MNQRAYLSLEEAANYLGISTSLLYKYTANQFIKHFKVSRKLIRFKITDLDEFMEDFKIDAINVQTKLKDISSQ